MSTLKFKISGSDISGNDATIGFTTDAVEWCYSHDWSVGMTTSGIDGAATYTIEVSNDNVTWYEYDANSTDLSVADSFEWDYFGYKYQRLVYTPTGVTVGTITALYTINNDN